MTDPLKLADEVESHRLPTCVRVADGECGAIFGYEFTVPQIALIAAALRLAEDIRPRDPIIEYPNSFGCRHCGAPKVRVNYRPDFKHKPGCAWDAYRAAKEKS